MLPVLVPTALNSVEVAPTFYEGMNAMV
jgi:hypothetical protein